MSSGTGPPTPEQRAKLQAVRTSQRRLRHAEEEVARAVVDRDASVLDALGADIRPSSVAYAIGLSLQSILQICGKDLDGANE